MIATEKTVKFAVIDWCGNAFEIQYVGYSNDPQDEFNPFDVKPEDLQAFIDDLEDCGVGVEYTLDAIEAMEDCGV